MKFFNLTNKTKGVAELYIYGEIVAGDKWGEDDVTVSDIKKTIDEMDKDVKTLNMYVNSPGGNVFTTIAIMSQLKRLKDTGVTINAYVDSVAASAASFVIMEADNIYFYETALMMIHKPMIGLLFGPNAKELRDKADWLDKVEQSTCIPAYMAKATDKLTEEKLDEMLDDETWLTADEVAEFFNVQIIEEAKNVVACIDKETLDMFSKAPKSLINRVKNKQETMSTKEKELRQRIADEAKLSQEYTKTILGGI